MAGVKGRSGGRRIPGPNAKPAGRPRQTVIRFRGEDAAVIRDGDTVAVIDASGAHISQASIVDGALVLTNDAGRTWTIVLNGSMDMFEEMAIDLARRLRAAWDMKDDEGLFVARQIELSEFRRRFGNVEIDAALTACGLDQHGLPAN